MKVINVTGSYYEIGLSTGKYLIEEKKKGFPPKFSSEKIEKAKEYGKVVSDYFPEILDEFKGMSESSGVDYDTLIAFELSPYRIQPNCLVYAISGKHTTSGFPTLVRNHEWIEEDAKNLRIFNTQPKGKLTSLGFTFHWPLASRYGGLNEAGLAISSASANFVNTGPGIMLNAVTRYILDNCKSIEEAVEFIETMPKVWGESYLMIDKNNTIVRVESHREKTNVKYSETGFDMVTFTYGSPEMQQYNSKDRSQGSSIYSTFEARKKFLDKWFLDNKGKIDKNTIINTLNDCNNQLHYHDKSDFGSEGTCWNWIAMLGSKTIDVCPGPACKNEFQQIEIGFMN
ncbi:MAG TPA: C45 family peptidase [candidate division Zixibacteria bacterium]|nr:C45 family peptidase [candidate division Zixibacteria bacterium]